MAPARLLIIFVLLFMTFGRLEEAPLIMANLPFALTDAIWTLYLLGYHQSVAPSADSAGVASHLRRRMFRSVIEPPFD